MNSAEAMTTQEENDDTSADYSSMTADEFLVCNRNFFLSQHFKDFMYITHVRPIMRPSVPLRYPNCQPTNAQGRKSFQPLQLAR